MRKTMNKIILLALLSFANGTFASEKQDSIQNAITSLGLTKDHFSKIWPNYCKPHWENTYKENLLETSELVKAAKISGFLDVKYNQGITHLSPGKTCKALFNYFMAGKTSEILDEFIIKDKKIKAQFGFSSLDLYKTSANYFESYNTYNWSLEDVRLLKRTIERHRKTNTFIIEEIIKNKATVKKDGEFKEINVKPYNVYYLKPSKALIAAHEKINS